MDASIDSNLMPGAPSALAGVLSADERLPGHRTHEAWERFMSGEPLAPLSVPDQLLQSWQRSRECAVAPHAAQAPLAVRGDGLDALRERNQDLMWAASGLFASSARLLAQSGSILLLTDPQGVVLEAAGDPRTLEIAQGSHLIAGGSWGEAAIGTNGIGTALATGLPTQVHAAEHFCEGIKRWTCAAAPVFRPGTGELIGVVDISGPPQTFQINNLVLATAAARQLESVLAERATRENLQLLEQCLGRIARSNAAATMVFDNNARLIHASGHCESLGLRLGASLPGLQTRADIDNWGERLPEGVRPEWLHTIRVQGRTLGALLLVPRPRHATSARHLPTGGGAVPI
ncbi:MAG: GAF domain-containing protein [Burkholderiales bacterium]|nr:GAF domain-containing protein [Burkholderiales bacterium]